MYVSRIRLKNIRCIDDLEIDLSSRAATNDSLLLLGNNGVGKSTILRSIAIGLCDRGGASALVADMYGNLIKEGNTDGVIEIAVRRGKQEQRITTTIERSGRKLESGGAQEGSDDLPLGTGIRVRVRPNSSHAGN